MTAVVAAVPATVAGMSSHLLIGLLVAALAAVLALCWVVADNDRTRRLTTLIEACRGTPSSRRVRAAKRLER